jgi:hypothetical protein
MRYLFEENCTETQYKVLVGKNIDLKVQFVQTVQNFTLDSCLLALTIGNQSLLLEMDEGVISEDQKNQGQMSRKVKNLNDLIYMFKRMLSQQY